MRYRRRLRVIVAGHLIALLCLSQATFWPSQAGAAQNSPVRAGYILVAADGGVFAFGATPFSGSMAGRHLDAQIVGAYPTSDGDGYWLVGRDRGVFAFGDAPFNGSQDNVSFGPCSPGVGCGTRPLIPVDPEPAVGINLDGAGGYSITMADGGVYPYGGADPAALVGGVDSAVAPNLAAPIVGAAHAADGRAGWEVGSDGGVFADAGSGFYGSLAGTPLAGPIVGIAVTADAKGYWLAGADGGVFAFGDAPFLGSLPTLGIRPNSPIVGVATTPDGTGYWLVSADGGVFSFGDAPYLGAMSGHPLDAHIVGIAAP